MVYSAGEEGLINVWKIPSNDETWDSYGHYRDEYQSIGTWAGHNDAIWDLQHHPNDNFLLSLGSDAKILLWKTLTEEENLRLREFPTETPNLIRSFMYKSPISNYNDVPTSCSWVSADPTSFLASYTTPFISCFDVTTGQQKY